MPQSSDSPAAPPAVQVIRVQGLTNDEFLQKYAGPGRIGLASGLTLIDKAICRAQRHLEAHGIGPGGDAHQVLDARVVRRLAGAP